jgi:hypothetical protein
MYLIHSIYHINYTTYSYHSFYSFENINLLPTPIFPKPMQQQLALDSTKVAQRLVQLAAVCKESNHTKASIYVIAYIQPLTGTNTHTHT